MESTCQICFDEAEATILITKFCGPGCPALICAACLKRHVAVALEVLYTGALPRVKCPICLVPVNRERWSKRLGEEDPERATLRLNYRRLCLTACRFGVPCCHKGSYVHMPAYYTTTLSEQYAKHAVPVADADALSIADKQRKKRFLSDLRRVGERFCRHDPEMTAGDVVRFLEDSFPDYDAKHDVHSTDNPLQIAYQLLATRIRDEERRARLVLAFHRRHPHMLTRCCGALMCFNCKRSITLPESGAEPVCVCERERSGTQEVSTDAPMDLIDSSSMIECRYCRITIVKVDGCGSVMCPCGVHISWDHEVRTQGLAKRGLLPVDVFDMTTFGLWTRHKYLLMRRLQGEAFQHARIRIQMRWLTRQEAGRGLGFCETLRRYALRRQFSYRLDKQWMPAMRMKLATLRCPSFVDRLMRLVWRRRFDEVVGEIYNGYHERSEALRALRQLSLLRKLYLSAPAS